MKIHSINTVSDTIPTQAVLRCNNSQRKNRVFVAQVARSRAKTDIPDRLGDLPNHCSAATNTPELHGHRPGSSFLGPHLAGLTLAFLGRLPTAVFQRLVLCLRATHKKPLHRRVGHLTLHRKETVTALIRRNMINAFEPTDL